LARKNNVVYIDYNLTAKPIFVDLNDFKDDNHLNVNGGLKISTDIAKRIKSNDWN